MQSFSYTALPGRVVFGPGASRTSLGDEVERLGLRRIMLVATANEAELATELTAPFSGRIAVRFDNVLPHVPAEVADQARRAAQDGAVDGLLSLGGGSTTGTAKIVALTTGLPIIAVPTTYAGSEMTPVWGMTTDARKETGRDMRVLPKTVVYDPDLVRTLPRVMAVASALNAMAHCVEALWTPDTNPVTRVIALAGVRELAVGLRAADPGEAASRLLQGAYLAGSAFAVAGSGLHHKICHALGGAFDLPHAETHAVILPRVTAFNIAALPEQEEALAAALGADDVVGGFARLYSEIGAPSSLRAVGLRADQLDEAIEIVAAKLPIANPREVGRDDIAAILHAAYGEER